MLMLNEFGNFTRAYRIQNSLLLYDMANDLKVGCAFLSGCECERHPIPEDWKELIPKTYPDIDAKELAHRIDKVNARFKDKGDTNAG